MEDANKTPRGGSGGLITATGPEEGLVVQGLCSRSFPTDFLESLGWVINSVRVYLGKRDSPASPWAWVEEEEGENHLLGIPLPLRVHELVCTEPRVISGHLLRLPQSLEISRKPLYQVTKFLSLAQRIR